MFVVLFGAGKKVLFCGSASRDLSGQWNDQLQYNYLPNEVLLDHWKYEEFKEKAYALLEMSDKSFLDKTKESKKNYMNFGDEYPHQIIHNAIQSKCR